jgi:hypothetical protein
MDVFHRLIKPTDHRRTWGFTLLMGGFLNITYWSLKISRRND